MSIDKFNFVRDGAIRLPPGFRFQPTDEELVFQYLKRKVFSCPLPASIIPEINVCKYDPWDLPGDLEQERYFFSSKDAKYRNGNRTNRATASGYWKATGLDKQIAPARWNHVALGMKKTLVFYRGKPQHGSRTDWVMHEYRLVSPCNISTQAKNSIQMQDCCQTQMDSWVICRIFLRKRSTRNDEHITKSSCNIGTAKLAHPRFFDIMMAEKTSLVPVSSTSSSSSSSSSFSDITEVSSTGTGQEERDNQCNNLF